MKASFGILSSVICVVTVAKAFAVAPPDAAPLPPLDSIIARALEQAKKEGENDRTFKGNYAFTRSKVTEFLDSKGEVKKRETKSSVHDPANAPASAKKGTNPNSQTASLSATNSNVRGKAFEKSDFPLNNDMLGRFDFTVAGRETINDRAALVLDFKPAKKKLPERNLKDKFINKAAGRIWLDETDAALVKADLHLTQGVNVVGGLVGAVWKFNCTIERERTPEGLWFTRRTGWHLEGREVFFQRIIDYHEETKDLRKTDAPAAAR